ncbi:MAG: peptidylprolyl isomerase, partial [Verrucomicrobia bacterium]|nr:peptidylprolyl isomerase [Verrucomicrobiota bacterium]
RQYTVWGKVIEGMELVDKIKMGSSRNNGSVNDPDHMIKVTVGRPVEDSKNSEEE